MLLINTECTKPFVLELLKQKPNKKQGVLSAISSVFCLKVLCPKSLSQLLFGVTLLGVPPATPGALLALCPLSVSLLPPRKSLPSSWSLAYWVDQPLAKPPCCFAHIPRAPYGDPAQLQLFQLSVSERMINYCVLMWMVDIHQEYQPMTTGYTESLQKHLKLNHPCCKCCPATSAASWDCRQRAKAPLSSSPGLCLPTLYTPLSFPDPALQNKRY